MTRLLAKLMPGDLIEWPDGERAEVVWVSDNSERFRVAGLPTGAIQTGTEVTVHAGSEAAPSLGATKVQFRRAFSSSCMPFR